MTEIHARKDRGIVIVLIERFINQKLPRILMINEKLDRGEPLDERSIAFLRELLITAQQIKPLIDRQTEYHDLYARSVNLVHHITTKALANERCGSISSKQSIAVE